MAFSRAKGLLLVGCLAVTPALSGQGSGTFSDFELSAFVNHAFSQFDAFKDAPEGSDADGQETAGTEQAVQSDKEALIKELKRYKISGVSFGVDPNLGIIFDYQDPEFDVVFKDKNGETKSRKIAFNINSVGLRLSFAFNLNLIFFVGSDLNFYDSRKKVRLGSGIIVDAFQYLSFTYVSFAKKPGGFIMVTLPIGISGGLASYVTGGSIRPIRSYDDDDE